MFALSRFRLPGGKRLRFLYVPDDACVRQFMVPKALVYTALGACFAGLGLLCFFGSRTLSAVSESRKHVADRAAKAQLESRLADLQEQVATLKSEMGVSLETQQKLRLVADLPELSEDVLAGGTGGPLPSTTSLDALSPETRADVEDVGRDITKLLAQARVQRDSYQEILGALEDRSAEWGTTPSVRPVTHGTLTSRFGRRCDPFTGQSAFHKGVDFVAVPGAAIRATADGVVASAEYSGGYGLVIEIDHGNGLRTRYAHCRATAVQAGQKIERRQIVGYVGSSGRSTGTHVHYEVIKNGLHVNPLDYVLPSDVVVD